jgi:pantoate--beta-alanine ligase
MRIVRTVRELREAVAAARAAGSTAALVPTMGALHEGHLSLVRAARSEHGFVMLSIFVNPKQFTDAADLAAYPREEGRDAALAEGAGVDLVFAPDAAELYPGGFATTVHVSGVATVVSKLLIAAAPDAAYFGQKDAQQLVVVRRMVADLGLPVRIVACPTSRDEDGLARSSRNVRLGAEQRIRALAIPRALDAIAEAARAGETDAAALLARGEAVLAQSGVDAEYLALVQPDTLEAVQRVTEPTLCAIAARVGDVRLIDNVLLGDGPGRR